MRRFKILIKRANYTLHLLAFVEIRLFNVFFRKEKRDSGY